MNITDEITMQKAKAAASEAVLPADATSAQKECASRHGFVATDLLYTGIVSKEQLAALAYGSGQALGILKREFLDQTSKQLRKYNDAIRSTQAEVDFLATKPVGHVFESVQAYSQEFLAYDREQRKKQPATVAGPLREAVLEIFRSAGVPEELLQKAAAEADRDMAGRG